MRRRLTPVASSKRACTAAYTFSNTRGTLGNTVGRTCSTASRDAQRIAEERDREADVRALDEHQSPEVVRERDVEEHHVVGSRVVLHLVDDARHREVVAVAHHAALRRTGRAGRVEDRVEVLLVDRGERLVERRRVSLREVDAVRREPREIVVRQDVLELRQLLGERLDLRQLLRVLADDPDCLRVLEEIRHVLRGAVRVHRDRDRADLGEREVHERPVEAVLSQDRERVALGHPAREQPVRVRADELVGIVPRDLAPPLAVVLDEVRRVLATGRDRIPPQPRDRPPLARRLRRRSRSGCLRHQLGAYSEGFGPGRRITRSVRRRARRASPLQLPNADHLERIPQLRPRLDPRRARAGDEAGRAPVGRLLPPAAPRVTRRRSSRSAGARPTIAR